MAFTHGKNTRLFIDQYEVTQYFSELQAAAKAQAAETTVFGQGAKTYIGGIKEGQLTGKGFFDASAVSAEDEILAAALGRNTNMILTASMTGAVTVGTRVIVSEAAETDYTVSDPVAGVVATSFSALADSGLSTGVVLYDPTTPITTIATVTGTGVNDTGRLTGFTTTGGMVAVMHVLTLTGSVGPQFTAKLQHSDDNSTWGDLVSFNSGNAVTAAGPFYVVVPYGTTIDRYVRASITTSGTTISTTVLISAARQ